MNAAVRLNPLDIRDMQIDLALNFTEQDEPITDEQITALVGLAIRWKAARVQAGSGGHGLSHSYIGFTLRDENDGHLLSGGIDREGRIST